MLHKTGMMDDRSTVDFISFSKTGQLKDREAAVVHSLPLSQAILVYLFV